MILLTHFHCFIPISMILPWFAMIPQYFVKSDLANPIKKFKNMVIFKVLWITKLIAWLNHVTVCIYQRTMILCRFISEIGSKPAWDFQSSSEPEARGLFCEPKLVFLVIVPRYAYVSLEQSSWLQFPLGTCFLFSSCLISKRKSTPTVQ